MRTRIERADSHGLCRGTASNRVDSRSVAISLRESVARRLRGGGRFHSADKRDDEDDADAVVNVHAA